MDEQTTVNLDEVALMAKVTELMTKIDKNQQLQNLAEQNGVDATNGLKLTDANKDNIAVAVLSKLLACQSNDPDYKRLTQMGLQHRSLNAEIINRYKNQAIQLINRYKDNL